MPTRARSAAWDWLLRALADPMTLLLLAAGPTYLVLGDTVSAAVAFGAIVPLAGAGFVLETRAERALAELAHLTAATARVQRDGQLVDVPGTEVVPGDLLEIREGDVVAADGRVVDVTQLSVDEGPLTGESRPVAKTFGTEGADDRVLAGTTVLSGRALVRVEKTGAATEYGRVGTLVEASEAPTTPLQRIVRRLVIRLGAFIVGFCVAVAGVQLLQGSGWATALLAAISLAIAALPEELPIVYTLYLALGARRLSREEVLVRRLTAVETLGATTVICTDKTGTLTLGHIAVDAVVTTAGLHPGGAPFDEGARRVLETAVLASEPSPFDPLDRAVVRAARESGIDVDRLHGRTLVRDYPFDPVGKYVTHVWSAGEDGLVVAAKGAVEGMLERTHPPQEVRDAVVAAGVVLAADGMRVIAVATGSLARSQQRAHDEAGLELVGLVGFRDPLRPGVPEAIRACTEAGVRVVMVTGDHPVTAHAVAEGIDLPHDDDKLATGADLDGADSETLRTIARDTEIFARTRPEQKHGLVEALQADGEVVAMTGDGINDAPALRRADIGVAMGGRGTEVAREAATMVLLDDNFATIVVAIREGRRIFDNLRTAFAYLVAFHVPLLAAALLVPFTGEPLLLLPAHLILLQVVAHPTAALAFEGDRPADDVMQRPPRPPRSSLMSRGELTRSLLLGATVAAAVLTVYLLRIGSGAPTREARASAFVTLLVGEILLVLVVRAHAEPFWRVGARGNRSIWWVLAATVAMAVATLAVPDARDLLRLGPLDAADVAIAIVAAVLATAWTSLVAVTRGRKSLRGRTVAPTSGGPVPAGSVENH